MTTERYLFICSIGPVQSFISAARTPRDLAFSSWLLSELAKAAALCLHEMNAELVFPTPLNPQDDLKAASAFNAGNKIMAIIDDKPENVAQKAQEAVQRRLMGLFELAKAFLEERKALGGIIHRARQQVEDMLEFYWSAAVFEEGNYDQVRDLAEGALRLRKNTRDFQPWSGLAGVPKSSLDGFREAVVVVRSAQNRRSRRIQRYEQEGQVLVVMEEPPQFHEGEVLSGVDLFKRIGGYEALPEGLVVPSTSDMAAKPFEEGLGEKAAQLRDEIKALLRDSFGVTIEETPGVYFFPERAATLIIGDNLEEVYEKRRRFRENFQDIWERNDIHTHPHPYYAFLVADGDNMGRLIDSQKMKEDHQRLSRTLADFASRSRGLILQYQGFPIYTGGDDIVAFFPLHTLMDALEELKQAFQEHMVSFSDESGRTPTLSGGVVIAHHLTPIEDVIHMAREAEQQAKALPEKHGLGLVLLRRSGETLRLRERWPSLVKHLKQWSAFLQQELIPHGLPYELRNLACFMRGTGLSPEAYRDEVQRILRQKRERGSDETLDEIVQMAIQERFNAIVSSEEAAGTLDQIACEIIAAMDIAKARELAHYPPYTIRDPEEAAV